MSSSSRQELVVVTGASSGIGRAVSIELFRRGFHVLAGVRREQDADGVRALGIEAVLLDITKPNDIQALAARVHGDPQGRPLRALVNNAGVGLNAPFEVFPLEEWRQLYEVNFFGHVAMTQTFLPALLANKGCVVNVSSVGGKIAMATYGPYASTKFALEAVSDSLRREVGPLGVKVIVVEPSAVKTEIFGVVAKTAQRVLDGMTKEQRDRYAALLRGVVSQAQAAEVKGVPPDVAGRIIADAISSKRPRSRYTVGREAAIITRMIRFLPDRLLDSMLMTALRPHITRASKG